MRPIWTGSISFGLISIPVSLYSATAREELKFRLLRSTDLSPVNYKRVAEVDGKEVPWDQIVKGYEYEKDKFVVLQEEDFKRADVEATQTVDIVDFVTLADINPMFFYKPYYVKPAKGGQKAYALLRDTLRDEGKVAIAKVVIKTRQYLSAVKTQGDALLLELMHFADELVEPAELDFPKFPELTKNEMSMAKMLVDQMSVEWDPHKYKDEYKNALMQLIEKKVQSGGHEVEGAKRPAKRMTNVVDLADVLRRSLKETAARKTKKPPSKKKAA